MLYIVTVFDRINDYTALYVGANESTAHDAYVAAVELATTFKTITRVVKSDSHGTLATWREHDGRRIERQHAEALAVHAQYFPAGVRVTDTEAWISSPTPVYPSRTNAPEGAIVTFRNADPLLEVTKGQLGAVTESFSPHAGRMVQLTDGRTVNCSELELAETGARWAGAWSGPYPVIAPTR